MAFRLALLPDPQPCHGRRLGRGQGDGRRCAAAAVRSGLCPRVAHRARRAAVGTGTLHGRSLFGTKPKRERAKMRKLAILLGGTMVLAACSSSAPPPPAPPVVDLNNPLMAPGYLAQAASSDQFEIQSGQLAQQMSQNPAV